MDYIQQQLKKYEVRPWSSPSSYRQTPLNAESTTVISGTPPLCVSIIVFVEKSWWSSMVIQWYSAVRVLKSDLLLPNVSRLERNEKNAHIWRYVSGSSNCSRNRLASTVRQQKFGQIHSLLAVVRQLFLRTTTKARNSMQRPINNGLFAAGCPKRVCNAAPEDLEQSQLLPATSCAFSREGLHMLRNNSKS